MGDAVQQEAPGKRARTQPDLTKNVQTEGAFTSKQEPQQKIEEKPLGNGKKGKGVCAEINRVGNMFGHPSVSLNDAGISKEERNGKEILLAKASDGSGYRISETGINDEDQKYLSFGICDKNMKLKEYDTYADGVVSSYRA